MTPTVAIGYMGAAVQLSCGLRVKCTKFDFGWGTFPGPLVELTAFLQTKLDFSSPTSKGGEGKKGEGSRWRKERGRVEREREVRRVEEGKGKKKGGQGRKSGEERG